MCAPETYERRHEPKCFVTALLPRPTRPYNSQLHVAVDIDASIWVTLPRSVVRITDRAYQQRIWEQIISMST